MNAMKMKACLFAALLSAATSASAVSRYSVNLTVSGYTNSTALENFPVLVRISEAGISGFNYDDCATNGMDLSFADAAGNVIPREIDTWNTNGESLVWVRLPVVTNGTSFTMHYADSSITEQPACQTNGDVWSAAGYKGVWHMNEINAKDSSGSGYDGMATTSALTVESGDIGSAVNFSASSGAHSIDTVATPNSELAGGLTIEARVKLSSTSGNQAFIGKAAFITFKTEGSKIVFTTPGNQDFRSDVAISASQWYHLALVFVPQSDAKFYVNGELKATVADNKGGFNDKTSSCPIRLGNNQWSQTFKGVMDECRISTSLFSSDWIAASCASQTNATFLTYGEVVDAASSFLNIVGSPSNIGAPSPGYGLTNGLSQGSTLALSMPQAAVAGEGTITNYLVGWTIEAIDLETETRTPVRDSSSLEAGENLTLCNYTHNGYSEFTWLWNPRDALGVGAPVLVASNPSSLELSVPVHGIGYSGHAVSLKIAYGPSAASLIYTNTVSTALTGFGDIPATLSRLEPGSTCFLKAILEGDGDERAESAVVSFSTASTPNLRICVPGIWQTWYPASTATPVDWSLPIWDLPVGTNWLGGAADATRTRRRELEPIAAYLGGIPGATTATSTVWGDTVQWPRNGMQWVYAGYMHLEAGKTYSFRTRIDDRAYVAVTDISTGEKKVIIDENNESAYNDVNTGSFTATATGWHPLEIRLWDATGGAGAIIENDTYRHTSALGYKIDGFSEWDFLTDPGDGSLLRVESCVETSERYANGALAYVDVTAPAGDLYVAFGPAEGTLDPATWNSVAKIATLSEAGTFAYAVPAEWGDDTHFAMAFYCDDGTVKAWSNPIYWRDASLPILTDIAADGSGGDRITMTGVLASFPGDDCTLTVHTGPSADSLTNVWSGLAGSTLSATGAFSLTLESSTDASDAHYLAPDSTIYLSVEAESAGRVSRSEIIGVPVLGYVDSVAGSASFAKKTATINWSLSGTWAQTNAAVKIFCGTSANEADMTELVDCGNIADTLPHSSTATLGEFNATYYFQVRAVATTAAHATPLEARSPVFSATTFDTTNYIWQPVGGDWNGDWNDSRHWRASSDDCIGYPDSSQVSASFENCTLENPVTVNVDGKYTIGTLKYFGTAASDVTLAGAGTASSGLATAFSTYGPNGIKANSTIVFSDMTLTRNADWDIQRDREEATNITVRFSNVVSSGTMFGMSAPFSRLEIVNGSNFSVDSEKRFNFGSTNSVLVIDNSTFTCNGSLHFNADNGIVGPVTMIIRGRNAKVVAQNSFFIYKDEHSKGYGATVLFDVPVGGYAETPIQLTKSDVLFGAKDVAATMAKFTFAVDPDSPALKKSREQLNLVVVQTVKGFNKSKIVEGIGTVPEHDYGEGLVPCGAFSYSSDDKQILLDLDGHGKPPTMFVIY